MKKLFTLILLVMCSFLLVACNGEPEKTYDIQFYNESGNVINEISLYNGIAKPLAFTVFENGSPLFNLSDVDRANGDEVAVVLCEDGQRTGTGISTEVRDGQWYLVSHADWILGEYGLLFLIKYNGVEYEFMDKLDLVIVERIDEAWYNNPGRLDLKDNEVFTVEIGTNTLNGFESISLLTSTSVVTFAKNVADLDYENNTITLTLQVHNTGDDVTSTFLDFTINTIFGADYNVAVEGIVLNIEPALSYATIAKDLSNKLYTEGGYNSDSGYYTVIQEGSLTAVITSPSANSRNFTISVLSQENNITSVVEIRFSDAKEYTITYQSSVGSVLRVGSGSDYKSLYRTTDTYFFFDEYTGTSSFKTADQKMCQTLINFGLLSLDIYCSSFAAKYNNQHMEYLGFTLYSV